MDNQANSDTINSNLSDFINARQRQLMACEYFAQLEANKQLAADARQELLSLEADFDKLKGRCFALQERLVQLEHEVRTEMSREQEVGSNLSATLEPSPPQQRKGGTTIRTPAAVFDVAEKVMCYSCMRAIKPGAVAYRYEDGAIYCEACESRAKQLSASA